MESVPVCMNCGVVLGTPPVSPRVLLKREGTVVPEPPKVPEKLSTPNTEKSRAP